MSDIKEKINELITELSDIALFSKQAKSTDADSVYTVAIETQEKLFGIQKKAFVLMLEEKNPFEDQSLEVFLESITLLLSYKPSKQKTRKNHNLTYLRRLQSVSKSIKQEFKKDLLKKSRKKTVEIIEKSDTSSLKIEEKLVVDNLQRVIRQNKSLLKKDDQNNKKIELLKKTTLRNKTLEDENRKLLKEVTRLEKKLTSEIEKKREKTKSLRNISAKLKRLEDRNENLMKENLELKDENS